MSQTPDFESIKQVNPYGQEYWSARELAPLLGYIQWRNFELAIKKAMIACSATDNIVEQHFADASKSSPMPHVSVVRMTAVGSFQIFPIVF